MKNNLKRMAALLVLLVLAFCAATAGAAEYTGERLYVDGKNASKVHLRQQPSTQSTSMGLIYTGTEVIMLFPENAEWYMVQLGAESGYISAEYVSRVQPESKAPVAYIYNPNSSWSNLRKGASTQSQAVGKLSNNEVVYVLAELSNGWTYVQRGAQAGFVSSSFLKSELPQQPAQPGQGEAGTQTQALNVTMEAVGYASNGDTIFRFTAPDNGQSLFFSAAMEKPAVYREDVNFDGIGDLVVTTASGASNQYSAFFVRKGTEYVQTQVAGLGYDLCNYSLQPQRRLVVSHANNGAAGAYHETAIFCWNGTDLKLLRKATGTMHVDEYDQNGLMMTAANPQLLRLEVRDYSTVAEGITLFENVVHLAAAEANLPYQDTALWNGLK